MRAMNATATPMGTYVMANKNFCDVERLPFEAAIGEIETIIKRLEVGDLDAEETLAIFERGEALKRHCVDLIDAIPGC
jgi:exodeoxyribonuclease VII small subunit